MQHEVGICRKEQPFVIKLQNRLQNIESQPESPPAPMDTDMVHSEGTCTESSPSTSAGAAKEKENAYVETIDLPRTGSVSDFESSCIPHFHKFSYFSLSHSWCVYSTSECNKWRQCISYQTNNLNWANTATLLLPSLFSRGHDS